MLARIKPLPTMAALLVIALTFVLGQWQTSRARTKEKLFEQAQQANAQAPLVIGAAWLETEQVAHRRVLIEGEFLPNTTVYLDNRFYQRQPGVEVLSTFRPRDSSVNVIVNRGWMPVLPDQRQHIRAPKLPAGLIRLEGVAQIQVPNYWNLGAPAAGKLSAIWPNFGFDAYTQLTGLRLQPFVVQQTSVLADELVRDWPIVGANAQKHWGYAFQWYALCVLTLVLWAWFSFKPRTQS